MVTRRVGREQAASAQARAIQVATVGQVPEGGMIRVRSDQTDVCIARVQGKFYAVADRCGHLGASLCEGTLEGTVATCPGHGSRWDLATGHLVRPPQGPGPIKLMGPLGQRIAALATRKPAKTYRVYVEGSKIMLEHRPVQELLVEF